LTSLRCLFADQEFNECYGDITTVNRRARRIARLRLAVLDKALQVRKWHS
jgi:hypothetical protein